MNIELVRKLINAGFTDEEISEILGSSREPEPKPAPAPKPEPKPAPAPKPEPKPAPAPAPKPEPAPEPEPNNGDLIKAIQSLETTIRASNLINSVLPTVDTQKTADDVLAKMLDPKKA